MAEIARDAASAVAELGRMVAVDTSFPPGAGYDAFAGLMEELVEPLGFRHRRVVVPEALWHVPGGPAHGPRTNVVAERRTGKPVCGLYFHVDTVPAAPGWTRDPLHLVQEDGRLYGLGAADMKGTIAAVLLALRAAARCGVELAYDPTLLLCTDEEGGLYPGVRYLAEQGMLEGHVLNFNGTAAPRIWAGCFGVFNLLVRLRGQAVHAGEGNRAGAGVNAIEAALPLLNALAALKPRVAARHSALPPPPHAKGPLAAQLSIAAAHGGICGGQVPALFEILVSRRYPPEESFEAALAEIQEAIAAGVADVPGLTVETDLVGHLIPTGDPTGPHWPRWQQALSAGFGYAPEAFRAWGAASCSDFGYVQRTGMQEVLLGGLGRPERNVHGPDEHTTVDDVVALARSVLAYLAADFAAGLIPETATPAL
ncbi:M20 family metallopeptidase [Limobrevibacterium gyesilva]|uniref:M20/M25/M40 family metallo-hydrolase n=1 Tax=Limobrevibacterium gyesilva TaxID=2991712 RepID=A0AA41YLK0_9PROT|nr:M20/M25/M40 family metallo-hydrolase [Limobrevibacterium gyesilva]MCW3476061.1 M20/M25/M40 family metallo-hydrolase [Limobrevibacterium gyesilva]